MACWPLRRFWRQFFVIGIPLLFLPLPLLVPTKPACCAYVIAVMGFFWLTEVVPMAVVSLLPVILFPLMGVQPSKDVCRNYFKDSVMLFVGSLIVAVAVEESNLHKRMALRVLLWVGSQPRWLMLGFMSISGFLSMWMSNTATTAMITPIAEAVVLELFERKRGNAHNNPDVVTVTSQNLSTTQDSNGVYHGKQTTTVTTTTTTQGTVTALSLNPLLINGERFHATRETDEKHPRGAYENYALEEKQTDGHFAKADEPFSVKDLTQHELRIAKGLVLSVAYAANIGGTATLTGTLPNIVFKGQIDTLYGQGTGVNFATFLLYSVPGAIVTLFVAWLWLQWIFVTRCACGRKKVSDDPVSNTEAEGSQNISHIIRRQYAELGSMSFGEASVLFLFVLLVFSWLFRSPQFIPGWEVWFPKGYVTDATPAILVSFLFFIWPSRLWGFESSVRNVPAILTWKAMKRKFPWDVFLLLGGAIALADGTQASGLTDWLKEQMFYFAHLPSWAIVVVISLLIATVTEFASNGAIATIFLPVLAKLAEVADVNPLYFMIPATIACSFAFMLPVATPPNAIAFGCGYIKIWDMIKAGFMLNILAISILVVNVHTMGVWVFDVLNKPAWSDTSMNTDLQRLANFNQTMG